MIQEEFDRSTGDFTLSPGEYEGPLTVTRPCVIDGQRATLWANKGPVLIVDSGAVTLKNLRIEVTGAQESDGPAALRSNYGDTRLENIEINGAIEGLPGETAQWGLPGAIALGDFATNKENSFSIEFEAPCDAEIVHNLKDVAIAPLHIRAGRNTLSIRTSNMRDNTILFGEMLIRTQVARRFYITGKAKEGAPEHTEAPPVTGELPFSTPLQIDPPDEVIAPIIPDDVQINPVRKGQRVSLGQMSQKALRLVYSHKSTTKPLDVDPYVFLLTKSGKVRSDNDLIFFGNEESANREVRVKSDNGNALAMIDLSKADADVERIAVCMSIYDDQSGTDFSCIEEPVLRLFSEEKEQFRFSLDELKEEKTVVAAEIYRYKGEWKVNFVGGGFKLGLDSLCRDYGVEVE